jgi:flavorubredoxin
MEELKFDIVDPGVSAKYVPSDDDLKNCRDLGAKIRQAILK